MPRYDDESFPPPAQVARVSALREAQERFAAAVQWYHQGRISGSKAGQVAGMTRLEFLDELARRRLDVVKVDLDQLREEIGAA